MLGQHVVIHLLQGLVSFSAQQLQDGLHHGKNLPCRAVNPLKNNTGSLLSWLRQGVVRFEGLAEECWFDGWRLTRVAK